MIILGLNAYHGDSSACIVIDGKLVAAAEEERFRRIKHWAGVPTESVKYCLKEAGVSLSNVDHIAINRKPTANLLKKAMFAISKRPSLRMVKDRLSNAGRVVDIKKVLAQHLGSDTSTIKARIHNVEHHRAHLASSFFVSPFDSAVVVSVDGFGDFTSTMWGQGQASHITVYDNINFPHSLGVFYLAMTQFLGFPNYGDEYKVMGLAPYGKPCEMDKMRKVVRLRPNGRFELDLDYFTHHSDGISMVWENGEPNIGRVFSSKFEEAFGPRRDKNAALSDHHKNLAASLQAMYEEVLFHLLDCAYSKTLNSNLCLAGGCAMNSVANGKVFEQSKFKELYIQSSAGDGGGSIGASFYIWNHILGHPRSFIMDHAYLGPQYSQDDIGDLLQAKYEQIKKEQCSVLEINDEIELCRKTAAHISEGKVIGWFQGRMEWGPRALGNRSIICDPRRADMKDILNLKIKRRESFRPFAPSIIREAVGQWFETDYDVPFMLQVYQILESKRTIIPAVTHVNGSGRLQTVTEMQNARYYRLIRSFEAISGVPIVLNTSFNENEPVVCKPEEALDCFLRTKMDVLVMNNWLIQRNV